MNDRSGFNVLDGSSGNTASVFDHFGLYASESISKPNQDR